MGRRRFQNSTWPSFPTAGLKRAAPLGQAHVRPTLARDDSFQSRLTNLFFHSPFPAGRTSLSPSACQISVFWFAWKACLCPWPLSAPDSTVVGLNDSTLRPSASLGRLPLNRERRIAIRRFSNSSRVFFGKRREFLGLIGSAAVLTVCGAGASNGQIALGQHPP